MKDRIFIYPSFYLYLQYGKKAHFNRITSHRFLPFHRVASCINTKVTHAIR